MQEELKKEIVAKQSQCESTKAELVQTSENEKHEYRIRVKELQDKCAELQTAAANARKVGACDATRRGTARRRATTHTHAFRSAAQRHNLRIARIGYD